MNGQKSDYFAPILIVGPCAMESESMARELCNWAQSFTGLYLRAPLFKPRTHPDSFQGLGLSGLPILRWMSEQGHSCVSEVLTGEQAAVIFNWIKGLQIGARNMQNFELLKEIGRLYLTQLEMGQQAAKLPFVLLKRGMANDLQEWMAAALYLERYGVPSTNIVLCERGSRHSSSPFGITLDLGLALEAKRIGPYPVIADPSHGSKQAHLVLALAKAAMAAGLDGVMIETHPRPQASISDAAQAISFEECAQFLSTTFLEEQRSPHF